MDKVNMLYCGMADDVAMPFAMPFEFDNLFVIDKFDCCYSVDGTWESQQKEIKKILTEGGNINSRKRKIINPNKIFERGYKEFVELNFEPCEIVEEYNDSKVWKLKLKQNEKIKEIIHYHHTDYINIWPEEIKNIKYLMSFGATFPVEEKILFKMLQERCSEDCIYFLQNYPYEDKKDIKRFDSFYLNGQKILKCLLHNSFNKVRKMQQCQY